MVEIQFWRAYYGFANSTPSLNQNITERGENSDEGQWSPLTLDSESSPVGESGSGFHLCRNYLLNKIGLWPVSQISYTSPQDSSFLISIKRSICRLQLPEFWNIAGRKSYRIGHEELHPGISHCFRKDSYVKAEMARAKPIGVGWA